MILQLLYKSLKGEKADINSLNCDFKIFVGNAAQNDDKTLVEIEKLNKRKYLSMEKPIKLFTN